MKTVKFIGSSLDDINLFPADVRRQVGYQLFKVQLGLQPDD
jgi:phage-related protein